MIDPLVSVVIPFYSGKEWLIEALESVINQTYQNLEILIINDGSQEDITNLGLKYKNKIQLINKKNGGPASARNRGIKESSGKYIAFLDSDDIWIEKKLENQIAYMEKKKSIWSHHSYKMFWENSDKEKEINTSKLHGDVYQDCYISFKVQTSCVVVNKEFLTHHNIEFPINKRYGQDLAFYKQIAKLYPLDYVEGVYSKFRIRGKNAGFQAKIQLNDKALTWKEMKNNQHLVEEFPQSIKLAYYTSNFFNNIRLVIQDKVTNNEFFLEYISKMLYSFPYLLFKINAIKRSRW